MSFRRSIVGNEEEEEEFICQVNKQYNYTKVEIHWQVAREGINPAQIIERVVYKG